MNVITRLKNNEYNAEIDPSQFVINAKFIKQGSEKENSYIDIWIEAKSSCKCRIGWYLSINWT